ncbi:MAG: site-2 protease family protein [Humidesulfovibrio sp.]|jgi:Zn-dependent protease|uniref:site-2 protease family protein n=1 Tax=Humidesulfovibrio sp. TaxID=2910988 RepID=UPI0027352D29|nr:site-2 protease family protein [Humidesulfovibrio sp.]MDP2846959.1 site-2 protease family protein [Humidesulfovibrio sp.]
MIDIAQYLREMTVLIVPLLLTITCHEAAHGLVASWLGDPTAKLAGRITLNPVRHIDPFGFLIMIVPPHIGWAKPVPVDSRYFKDQRTGMLLVAIAGPGANLLVAALCAALFHALGSIPVTDPDGLGVRVLVPLLSMAQAGVYVSLLIGAFNLLPIPPLDGSNILARFLPEDLAWRYLEMGRYGILVIIGLMLLGNVVGFSLIGTLLFPVVRAGADIFGMNSPF